jgi:hypothetical protein
MSTIIENSDVVVAPRKKKKAPRTLSENSQQSLQPPRSYTPRTALGRKLWTLRQQMVASGSPLLRWNELESEIAERRGEWEKEVNETDVS